jgi:hypothetical protein
MSQLSQQDFYFAANLNPFASKNPPCSGEISCGEHHDFGWDWISQSNLEPLAFLKICCKIICYAAAICDKQGAFVPLNTTKISCDGQVRTIEWEEFRMRVFNDPAPNNALQATLGSVCATMYFNTENRTSRLGYGKHSLRSRKALSRCDILNAFKNLRAKGLDEICNGIKSIRVQNFIQERDE